MAKYAVEVESDDRVRTEHDSPEEAASRACVVIALPRHTRTAQEAIQRVAQHFADSDEPFVVEQFRRLTIHKLPDDG